MEESEIDHLNQASAQEIITSIKALEKELSGIQELCPHTKYSIKNTQESPTGGFCLKRLCDLCHCDLGYPNPQELDKWMNS